jgi:hypothetical protein
MDGGHYNRCAARDCLCGRGNRVDRPEPGATLFELWGANPSQTFQRANTLSTLRTGN